MRKRKQKSKNKQNKLSNGCDFVESHIVVEAQPKKSEIKEQSKNFKLKENQIDCNEKGKERKSKNKSFP